MNAQCRVGSADPAFFSTFKSLLLKIELMFYGAQKTNAKITEADFQKTNF
jgi:hypothetical protein